MHNINQYIHNNKIDGLYKQFPGKTLIFYDKIKLNQANQMEH